MAERFLPESKVVKDALARIGDDPRARFAFFKRLLAVAQEVAGDHRQPDGFGASR